MQVERIYHSQQEAEVVSESHESRRLIDVYSLSYNENKLISPYTRLPIEYSMVRDTVVDEQEWRGFQHLQDWVGDNTAGVSFLLFPPHISRSPQAKLIVSELEEIEGEKYLLNRAILFNVLGGKSLDIANGIAAAFSEQPLDFTTEEEVRSTPVFSSGYLSTHVWLDKISQIIDESSQWEMIATGNDLWEAERTVDQMRVGAVPVGNNPLSCPPGSASLMMNHHAIEGRFVHNCGNCGVEIKKVIFTGYVCSRCEGVYKGC